MTQAAEKKSGINQPDGSTVRAHGRDQRHHPEESVMEMLEAMSKCVPGGYVARKTCPDHKYYKSCCGIFYEAARVGHADFTATDWEYHSPNADGRDR